jgi:hypothetical protein
MRILSLALVMGAIMPVEASEGLSLTLTNRVGNEDVSTLSSVWDPWPQEDLWDIINPGYFAESHGLHRFYGGYPEAIGGDTRATIKYSSAELQRFSLVDSEMFWRWQPSRPNGGTGTNLYQKFALDDPDSGDSGAFVMAEIEAGTGGGGEPTIIRLTDPDPPYADPPDSYDNLITSDWDPSGTYLAVGGYNGDFDTFFAWYKRSGTSLTKLSLPSSAPNGAAGVAWDATGTYLAIGANTWWGMAAAIYLYKRSGDALTLVDTVAPGGVFFVGEVLWMGDYLVVGNFYNYTQPWNSGNDGIGLYLRSGDALSFVGSETVELHTGSFDLSPDGNYLLVCAAPDFDTNQMALIVYSWDGAGALAEVERVGIYGGGTWPRRARWHPAGGHIAVAVDDWLEDGWGARVYSWDVGTETLTHVDQGSSGTLTDFEGWDVDWAGDGAYLIVSGDETGVGDSPALRAFSFTAISGSLSWVVDSPTIGDDGGYYAHTLALHPDDDMAAVGANDGNVLYLFGLSGFSGGSDLVIRLSAGAWTDEGSWEAAYSATDHAWIRFRHDEGAGTIYLETADVNCGCWTERLAYVIPASPVADFTKLALEAEAWVTTAETDTSAPSYGFYGPLNPIGDELSLTLTNAVQTLYLEGTSGLTLELANQIGET